MWAIGLANCYNESIGVRCPSGRPRGRSRNRSTVSYARRAEFGIDQRLHLVEDLRA